MMARRFELPLEDDASSRFLPWIVSLMTYLASLCLAIFLFISGAMERWRDDLSGQLIVQILPSGLVLQDQERAEQAVDLLRRTHGVASVRLLSPEEMNDLLAPWLGNDILTEDFPAPRMIKVAVNRGLLDIDSLRHRLNGLGEGVILDDHQNWLADIVRLSDSLKGLALFITACVGVAAWATVVFVTRSGLAVHASVIEVLHLVGARDSYIANQFQRHAFRMGARGALVGFFLALATMIGLAVLAGGLRLPLAPALDMNVWQWLVLAGVPVISIFITALTARLTVMLVLARMF